MATIERFEDLKAWQKARELTREVYLLCDSGALGRDFNLRNSLCRATTNCMSKIAEGYALRDRQLFASQLDKARGYAIETQSLFYVAKDNHHLPEEEFARLFQLTDDVLALMGGLLNYLRK
jgi:four helix bundle protein